MVVVSMTLLLLCLTSTEAISSQCARVAVLHFHCSGVDTNIMLRAEERMNEVIGEEESFELIPRIDVDEERLDERTGFLRDQELRKLMKELGASVVIEGSLERTETDRTNIEIRICSRSSSWRPPTVLSATEVAPEYAVPRTESLVRKFLQSYSSEQSMERFFQSALVPGLGQFREGYKTKAGFFFFGTTGLLVGSLLLPDGDPYEGDGAVEMRQFPGNITRWYIGDTPVTQEEAEIEIERRADAKSSRETAQRRKRYFVGAGLVLYAINLYDILKITRRYDTPRGNSFSFRLNPLSPKKFVCFDCSFNF